MKVANQRKAYPLPRNPQPVINRMAERARQAKMRNRLLRAANKMKAANAAAKAAKNAKERNEALAAAKKAQEELSALKAAANAARATKISNLRELVNGLNVSNLFEQQQKNKLASAKKVLENNRSNIKNINASINQLKVVTTAVKVRKNPAAEEEKRKKAEENARKKAEENALKAKAKRIENLSSTFGVQVNNSTVNNYSKVLSTIEASGLNKNSLVKKFKNINGNFNKKYKGLTSYIRVSKGAPIVIGVVRGTNINSYKFANGVVTGLGVRAPITNFRNKVVSKTDIDAVFDSKSAGLLLMGASGSGKTVFAENLERYLTDQGGLKYSKGKTEYISGALAFRSMASIGQNNGGFYFEEKAGAIYGMTHAATPFNKESSRVQTLINYKKGDKNLTVVDMAGNEDIFELYKAFLAEGGAVVGRGEDITTEIINLIEGLAKTTGSIPIPMSTDYGNMSSFFELVAKRKKTFINLYNKYKDYGDLGPNYYLEKAEKFYTRGYCKGITRGTAKKMALHKNLRTGDDQYVLQEVLMAVYIAARLSEGVYITSTIRSMSNYLLNVRSVTKNLSDNKELSNANRNTIYRNTFNSIAFVPGSGGGSLRTHGLGQLRNVNKYIKNSNAPAYTLSKTNLFIERLTKIQNIAIFPVFNVKGSNNKLSQNTYATVKKLTNN